MPSNPNPAAFGGQEHTLENRKRHLRRLKWAARRVDDATAVNAYMAFTAGEEDDDLELAFGRLLVLLDHLDLFEDH